MGRNRRFVVLGWVRVRGGLVTSLNNIGENERNRNKRLRRMGGREEAGRDDLTRWLFAALDTW